MKDRIPSFLLLNPSSDSFRLERRGLKIPFLEKGIHRLAEMIKMAYAQWEFASREGFFQKIDSRIKVLFLIFFIMIVSLKQDIGSEILVSGFILFLMLASRLNVFHIYKRIFISGLIFGSLVALPSIFNLFREGEVLFTILRLSRPYEFWIYSIPEKIGITKEGLYGMIMLTLRVINSLSITFLVLYTTPFAEIIKALKVLKIPDTVLIVITLTYKYLFLFAKTVEDMHLAKKGRLLRDLSRREARRWIAGRIALTFKKTRLRAEEVFKAMLCRGFSDSIKIYGKAKLGARDWVAGTSLFLVGCLFLWI
jgi:cobalt ECF transporter T component CbiQ